MDDQILLQGPFRFSNHSGSRMLDGHMIHWGYDIVDQANVSIASITGQLIDGSGGHKATGGRIRTHEQRDIEAKFVLDAMNAYWLEWITEQSR